MKHTSDPESKGDRPSNRGPTHASGSKSGAESSNQLNGERLKSASPSRVPGVSGKSAGDLDDNDMTTRDSSACCARPPLVEETRDPEQKERKDTRALFQQLKEQREREKQGLISPCSLNYVLRHAGENLSGLSKKKQKELQVRRASDPDDLGSKSMGICRERSDLEGNEFDAIPSNETLKEKYRSKADDASRASSLVTTIDPAGASSSVKGGFKIDTFAATVAPPPFTGFESSFQTGSAAENQKALEAILPQVDNSAVLVGSSRSVFLRKATASVDRPLICLDQTSPELSGSGTGSSGSSSGSAGEVKKPAFASNRRMNSAENDSVPTGLASFKRFFGRSAASTPLSFKQDGLLSSASA